MGQTLNMDSADTFTKTMPHKFWNSVSEVDWISWRWQLQNRIDSVEKLRTVLEADPPSGENIDDIIQEIEKTESKFNFSITPYYFSLIDFTSPACPIRRQAIPSSEENIELSYEFRDFPKEDQMMPVPGLTHRYPDRVMLYTTHHCAMYCRFCTRKRKVSNPSTALHQQQIQNSIDHIAKNPHLREIVLSGGDVFSFGDDGLDKLLKRTRAIEHIEIVRLGTRNLVTLPFRSTPDLIGIFKNYLPLYIHTHFNHPKECSLEAFEACRRLRDAGCVVNNHTVILRGINDDAGTLKELNRRLLQMGAQPYYMYHCDMTFGSSHFRTMIADDVELVNCLHANTDWGSDANVPHYMVDTPGGGKIELA